MTTTLEKLDDRFYVTLLSNFARGYDKYARIYSKQAIPESRHPGLFFLLTRDDIGIGIKKTASLMARKGKAGDRMIAIRSSLSSNLLHPNTTTGLGEVIARDWVDVRSLCWVDNAGLGAEVSVEEAYAASLLLHRAELASYESLRPRTVSVLPVAVSCEAACRFCFSKASASVDQAVGAPDMGRVREVLLAAKTAGAERAVITGGGEPGMLDPLVLRELAGTCSGQFDKVVLITNGYFLSKRTSELSALHQAGVEVLAVSRHHHDPDRNAALMRLRTCSEDLPALVRRSPGIKLRWICVLQKGGIDSENELCAYLSWAARNGVSEICFKELYVSTTQESVYHSRPANEWSACHQVPLRLILDFASDHGWSEVSRLPWGAPVFRGRWEGAPMQIAAYTEPSLFWERSNGICRSWNLMADGRCLASLEDRRSEVPAT